MFLQIVIFILIITTLLSGLRLLLGPSLWDRLLGLSLVSSKIIIIIILYALITESSFYLDIALVIAILGFVGTTSLSSFLKKGGK